MTAPTPDDAAESADHMECSAALERMFLFLDNEMNEADCSQIRQHLADCEPCLDEYDAEGMVKSLVHRACCSDKPPAELRQKVLRRIRQVQADIGTTDG